ncbi:hypothetical protein LY90DRAFT_663815 [Neocallimastix californiae]|uniref:Citrate transporter-like domain-containing protein n=1 Tax=Neocallimastix californiae TaxID=1754190 RepID=A0A1Y2FHG9_9FUNG|nr:hypothetical protein LY90DRAFT_663815 [Neocallimastix californiae]|eukprot:ORY83382.1 hypothetical protein LY90DRAFT_663815 [Neocallimastix californiae]
MEEPKINVEVTINSVDNINSLDIVEANSRTKMVESLSSNKIDEASLTLEVDTKEMIQINSSSDMDIDLKKKMELKAAEDPNLIEKSKENPSEAADNKNGNRFKRFLKNIKLDPVLLIAWFIAIISAFFIYPDREYIDYIDWRSLGILWSLMIVVQGFKKNSVFEKIGQFLLKRVTYGWQLAAVLIFMCFFGSMLITNDVALITFVPFAIMILKSSCREDLMIPVVVYQTVAANMGSMLTPIGNPQNLYLYGVTGMSIWDFLLTMLPLSSLTLVLLALCIFTLPKKTKKIVMDEYFTVVKGGSSLQIVIYFILFLLALCTVLRLIPWYIVAGIIFVVVAILDYKIIFRADYILLLTFIGFFIFTGNIGRITKIKEILEDVIQGREFLVSALTSQLISNVPATLLLTGFTHRYKSLLQGVNVGGLGTLIASMASLISYKAISNVYPHTKGKYLKQFTLVNIVFLIILCAFCNDNDNNNNKKKKDKKRKRTIMTKSSLVKTNN